MSRSCPQFIHKHVVLLVVAVFLKTHEIRASSLLKYYATTSSTCTSTSTVLVTVLLQQPLTSSPPVTSRWEADANSTTFTLTHCASRVTHELSIAVESRRDAGGLSRQREGHTSSSIAGNAAKLVPSRLRECPTKSSRARYASWKAHRSNGRFDHGRYLYRRRACPFYFLGVFAKLPVEASAADKFRFGWVPS